jgi:hypothetical protein
MFSIDIYCNCEDFYLMCILHQFVQKYISFQDVDLLYVYNYHTLPRV